MQKEVSQSELVLLPNTCISKENKLENKTTNVLKNGLLMSYAMSHVVPSIEHRMVATTKHQQHLCHPILGQI